MLEVVPESVADEDHLLLEFPIFGVLGDCFKVEVEELCIVNVMFSFISHTSRERQERDKRRERREREERTFFSRLSFEGRTNWMMGMSREDWQ